MYHTRKPHLFGILFLTIFLGSQICAAAPGSFNFDYNVDGQTVTLQPSIAAVYDDYRWTIRSSQDLLSSTDWIDVDDIHDHKTILEFNETYIVTLTARDGSRRYQVGHPIRIGSSNDTITTLSSVDEPDNGFNNMFDSIPDSWKQTANTIHPTILIGISILCVSLIFYGFKKKKNFVVYKILKKVN